MNDESDFKFAEAAVSSLASQFGVPVDPAMVANYAVMLAGLLRGRGFAESVAAGVAAAQRIRTEADAERSRRERMGT